MNEWDDAVIVALGSNLRGAYPSIEALLDAALARLPAEGLTPVARSSWWRSASWPDPAAPAYLNGVVLVDTALGPRGTLDALRRVEAAFGRRRGEPNAPRTLDLDLVAHGRTVLDDPDLTLPHPRAHERRFVIGPLAEVAPGWAHPVLGKRAAFLRCVALVGHDARPIDA